MQQMTFVSQKFGDDIDAVPDKPQELLVTCHLSAALKKAGNVFVKRLGFLNKIGAVRRQS